VLNFLFKMAWVILFCLAAVSSVVAVERQHSDQGMNVPAFPGGQISQLMLRLEPLARSTRFKNFLLVAEGCLAKCERESRECDERHRDDDGSEGDVCEQAYIKCDRACGD